MEVMEGAEWQRRLALTQRGDDDGEALRGLWRAWRSVRRRQEEHELVATARRLLAAAAATRGAGTALARALLRLSAEDAARDLLVFAQAAEAWDQSPDAPPQASTRELWTQLIQAANAIMVSRTAMASEGEEVTTAWEDTSSEEAAGAAMSWAEFVALPCALDASALQTTKDGRALLQHVDEIAALQQWRLTTHADDEPSVDELLTEAVRRLERSLAPLVEEADEKAKPTTHATHASYGECADMASVDDYLRRDGVRAAPTAGALPQCNADAVWVKDKQASSLDGDDTYSSQDTFDTAIIEELDAIRDMLPLSIRVVAILGRQAKTRRPPLTHDRDDWEQRIRKEVNSLTSGADQADQLMQLLRFAAVAPATVVDVALGSVLSTTHHHVFFAQLFAWCPLILRWRDDGEPSATSSQLVTALVETIMRVVNAEDASARPLKECAGFQFLLELSARTGILEPGVVLETIFGRLLDMLVDPIPLARLFDCLHGFLSGLRENSRRCAPELVAKTFAVVGEHYRRHCFSSDDNGAESDGLVDYRDLALLLSQELGMASQPGMLKDWSCDVATETLFEVLGIRSHHPFEEEVDLVISPALASSIQRCLWSLTWAADGLTPLAETEASSRLTTIAGSAFACPFNTATVVRADVVQVEIAKLLFASGKHSFDRILKMLDTVLLPMEQEAELGGSDMNPAVRAATLPPPEPRELTEYVFRCWCLGAFAVDEIPVESVVRLLGHTMETLDRAIDAAATAEASGRLLRYLRMLGLVNAWLHDGAATRPVNVLSQRVEIAAVRVLYVLAQLSPDKLTAPHDEPLFRQSVAAVLSESRLLESETIARFLQTTVQHG